MEDGVALGGNPSFLDRKKAEASWRFVRERLPSAKKHWSVDEKYHITATATAGRGERNGGGIEQQKKEPLRSYGVIRTEGCDTI